MGCWAEYFEQLFQVEPPKASMNVGGVLIAVHANFQKTISLCFKGLIVETCREFDSELFATITDPKKAMDWTLGKALFLSQWSPKGSYHSATDILIKTSV